MTTRAACSRLASVAQFQAAQPECGCVPTDAEIAEALDDASDLVYQLSGGSIFGSCTATVRPMRACFCGSCDGCCSIDYIQLRGPVISVGNVTIDGDTLDPATYALTADDKLYRLAGADGLRPDHWPCCQKLYLALGEEDTWSITYTFGQASQPIWVRNAVIELAADMVSFWKTRRSKLPSSVTAVTYQNVSASMQSRAEALANGDVAVGLPALSQLISLTNPHMATSGIYSPDDCYAWTLVH